MFEYDFDFGNNCSVDMNSVLDDGMALEHISAQTDLLCFNAVSRNGLALQYATNQHPSVCLMAATQNINALELIRNYDVKKECRRLLTQ